MTFDLFQKINDLKVDIVNIDSNMYVHLLNLLHMRL